MRLSPETAPLLPPDVARPAYDRTTQACGIVHFGIGAFHRAHMAWYTDLAMDAGESDWAICGVSLRSRDVAEQLQPQGGLYTLTERSGSEAHTRLVGAVREVLYAPDHGAAVVARIADPACHVVSFTVTEKGYARGAGNSLDLAAAGSSFYPLLAEGLEQRRQRGLGGITLLPCDNLPNNGRVLEALMRQWLEARAPGLAGWFASHCTVAATMIDRIVPRTTPADIADLAARLGLEDAGAVFTERFSQWVIEDRFAGPRPRWEDHGAQLVADVEPYETAKLRMLNGAHSALAYCGLRAGHEYVHQAIADPALRAMADQLMLREAAPTIAATPDQDLVAYAAELVERFADPALNHRLAQIAMDGTQKLPQRWLDTVLAQAAAGGSVAAIRTAFDAWLWHLEDGRFVDDPAGEELVQLMRQGGRGAVLSRCFAGPDALWPDHARALALLAS